MTHEVQRRLRDALHARAGQVEDAHLDPAKRAELLNQLRAAAPAPPRPKKRPALLPKLALAASAAAVAGVLVTGELRSPGESSSSAGASADGRAGATAAASGLASTSGFAVPGGFVQGPTSVSAATAKGESLTLTPVFTIIEGRVTVGAEVFGTHYSKVPNSLSYSLVAPDGSGFSESSTPSCDVARKTAVTTNRTFGTYALGGGQVTIAVIGCNSAGEPVELKWSGTVLPAPD